MLRIVGRYGKNGGGRYWPAGAGRECAGRPSRKQRCLLLENVHLVFARLKNSRLLFCLPAEFKWTRCFHSESTTVHICGIGIGCCISWCFADTNMASSKSIWSPGRPSTKSGLIYHLAHSIYTTSFKYGSRYVR